MLYDARGKLIGDSSALKRYELGHTYPSAWARHRERACLLECYYCWAERNIPKHDWRTKPAQRSA